MFTHCPECLKSQPVSADQLRSGRGMVRCRHCGAAFDALAALSETETAAASETPPAEALWQAKKPRKNVWRWRIGALLAALLLTAQLVYFESERLLNHPKWRPTLDALCSALRCRLPPYRNLSALSVLHHEFNALPNQRYIFKLVLNNDSAFAMPYPAIGLTLQTFDGQAFARRVFQPHEYLPAGQSTALLPARTAADISLEIAPTKAKVGGFQFDLGY